MVKQIHTKSNLLTALDLCQAHYQLLLRIFLKGFIMTNAQIVNLVLNIYQVYLIFKCLKCKRNHKKRFNKDLIKRFESIYEFCNGYIIVLLLRKVINLSI